MNVRRVILAAVLVTLSGCSDSRSKPKTIAECESAAVEARDQAKSAREAGNPKDAARAAEWALTCSNLAGGMLVNSGCC